MGQEITWADGHIEPSIGFDYDAVDRANGSAAESESPHDLSEAFDRILFWCWGHDGGRRSCKSAFMRFAAMNMALKPGIFGDSSYKQIGKELGVTKAWLSKVALEFQDQFGVHFRRGRAEAARSVFKKTAKRTHDKRKRLDRGKSTNGTLARRFAEAHRGSGDKD